MMKTMTIENRFNLIDEPWIPVSDHGPVSLRQIFTVNQYKSLGGNPVEKIALLKLLQAITHAAVTPENDNAWQALGYAGLAVECLAYLERWHHVFYLFGEQPFLQMPAINKAEIKSYGTVLPYIATGNSTVITHGQIEGQLSDAEKAIMLVVQMSMALGGKKTDNEVVLTAGYRGKTKDPGKATTGRPGPGLAFLGMMHSFYEGTCLQETLWLNMFTCEEIQRKQMFTGVGIPPWEKMPAGEDDDIARALKSSLVGRLVPLCRFCLLVDSGLHYSEGIAHANYQEGIVDPSVAVNFSTKKPLVLWIDPEKKPWRELMALLGFFVGTDAQGFECWQIKSGFDRIRSAVPAFAIWSGGLRVSSNAGEQFVSGNDDFVQSQVWLESCIIGEMWFQYLKAEIEALEGLSKGLYGRVKGFYADQKLDGAKYAALASNLFWQYCEKDFHDLIAACSDDGENPEKRRLELRQNFACYVLQIYDLFCPMETARQLEAWAKNKPNNGKYLKREN